MNYVAKVKLPFYPQHPLQVYDNYLAKTGLSKSQIAQVIDSLTINAQTVDNSLDVSKKVTLEDTE